MSYNGTGIYTLPGAQLINGEVVSATENNQFRNDVASALNTAWTRDGQAQATANIPMANHKFTGLLPGTENGDSVCYEQVSTDVDITGGTIAGVEITDSTAQLTALDVVGVTNLEETNATNVSCDSIVSTVYKETKTTILASNIDLSAGNYFSKTISTNTTFTVSNVPTLSVVASFILDLTNGGAATITWMSGITWAYGEAPVLSASGRDVLGFFTYDNGTTWSGFPLGIDMS